MYAKRQQLSEETIAAAHAVKIDAMTLLGAMLKEGPKAEGTRGNGRPFLGGTKVEPPKNSPATQSSLLGPGGKKTAAAAQALATVAKENPEVHAEVRAGTKTVATPPRSPDLLRR